MSVCTCYDPTRSQRVVIRVSRVEDERENVEAGNPNCRILKKETAVHGFLPQGEITWIKPQKLQPKLHGL